MADAQQPTQQPTQQPPTVEIPLTPPRVDELTLPARPNLVRRPSECIEEMESCSLKDSERCFCFWQIFRVIHGIFHWINTLSCLRKNHCTKDRRRHRDEDDEAPDQNA